MDKVVEKKILEAKEHVQLAEKSLKTTFFKRTADYDTAASEYTKAATCCKVAKQLDKAIEYYQKAAECYINLKSEFNAGKQYEQAAFAAHELKRNDIVFDTINKAADLFIDNGTRDTAQLVIEKGANMLKMTDPEKALHFYKRAINVAEVEDKYHDMVSLHESAMLMCFKLKKLTEAVEFARNAIVLLDKIQNFDAMNKYMLTLVIIHLSNDDWVSATKEIQGIKERYQLESDCKAFGTCEELVTAYDEKDEDKFRLYLKNYLSYAVDNEVLKVAQTIPKTGIWHVNLKPKETPKPQTNYSVPATSYEPPAAPKSVQQEESKTEEASESSSNTETEQYEEQQQQQQPPKPAEEDDDDEPDLT